MRQSVIIQFKSFDERDRFLPEIDKHISRIYRRNPWLAAELSDDEISRLRQDPKVEIFPDVQMAPFPASSSR